MLDPYSEPHLHALRCCHVLDAGTSPFLHWYHSPTFSPTFLIQAIIGSSSIQIAKTVELRREDNSTHLQVFEATWRRDAFTPIEALIQKLSLKPFHLDPFDPRARDGEINSFTLGAGTNHSTFTWWDAMLLHDEWQGLVELLAALKVWESRLTYLPSSEYTATWVLENEGRQLGYYLDFKVM